MGRTAPAIYYTAVGLEKCNREQRTHRHTDREFNYRGHSIAVPMERWVERANTIEYQTKIYATNTLQLIFLQSSKIKNSILQYI